MKRLISILLVMLMLVPTMVVSAAEKTQFGELEFVVPDNFVLSEEVSGGKGYINSKYESESIFVALFSGIGHENIEELSDEEAVYLAETFLSEELIVEAFATREKYIAEFGEKEYDCSWCYTDTNMKFLHYISAFEAFFEDGSIDVGYAALSLTIYEGNCYLFFNYGSTTENDYEAYTDMMAGVSVSKNKAATSSPAEDHDIKIMINDARVYPDSEPVIINGRTLCPIRAIAEKMGYEVEWLPETRTVKIKNQEREIQLSIGGSEITGTRIQYDPLGLPDVIDVSYKLDVPAQIINDRTYLPLRAVSEALRCLVDWNENTRTVLIETAYYGEKVYLIKESGNYHKKNTYCVFYERDKILSHTEEYLNDVKIRGYKACPACFSEE